MLHDCHLLTEAIQTFPTFSATTKAIGINRIEVELRGALDGSLGDRLWLLSEQRRKNTAYEFRVFLRINASVWPAEYEVSGAHDKYPAFEAYINDEPVLRYDPRTIGATAMTRSEPRGQDIRAFYCKELSCDP